MNTKQLTILALAIATLFTAADSRANETIDAYRRAFQWGEAPHPTELDKTDWECHSVMAYGANAEFTMKMFHFDTALHNPNLLFSYFEGKPKWVPAWVAKYQGLRVSIPIKTNDFISSCAGPANECIQEGQELSFYAYFRAPRGNRDSLYIEWTLPAHPMLSVEAYSLDEEVGAVQKAWMYSRCWQIPRDR